MSAGRSSYSPVHAALLPHLSAAVTWRRVLTRLVCVAAYTELAMSTVKQTQAIPFTGPYSLLVCHLRNLTGKTAMSFIQSTDILSFAECFFYPPLLSVSGDVEELDGTEKNTLKIFDAVTLIHEVGMVLLEVRGHTGSAGCSPAQSLEFIHVLVLSHRRLQKSFVQQLHELRGAKTVNTVN